MSSAAGWGAIIRVITTVDSLLPGEGLDQEGPVRVAVGQDLQRQLDGGPRSWRRPLRKPIPATTTKTSNTTMPAAAAPAEGQTEQTGQRHSVFQAARQGMWHEEEQGEWRKGTKRPTRGGRPTRLVRIRTYVRMECETPRRPGGRKRKHFGSQVLCPSSGSFHDQRAAPNTKRSYRKGLGVVTVMVFPNSSSIKNYPRQRTRGKKECRGSQRANRIERG